MTNRSGENVTCVNNGSVMSGSAAPTSQGHPRSDLVHKTAPDAPLPWHGRRRIRNHKPFANAENTVAVRESVGLHDPVDRHPVTLGKPVKGVTGLDHVDPSHRGRGETRIG